MKACVWIVSCVALVAGCAVTQPADTKSRTIGQWGMYEVVLNGPSEGNPFMDVQLSAAFTNGDKTVTPTGFYDGNGTYRIRFMPEVQGKWRYTTKSNRPELDGKSGEFTCVAPRSGVHGPVRVRDQFHFAYADGTPYRPLGTTAYNWANQGPLRKQQTLETLAHSPFNKVRMSVLPMQYDLPTDPEEPTRMRGPGDERLNDPKLFAFEGKPLRDWDFTRFSPAFWHEYEKCIEGLAERGVEADIILLFSNNKKMGFDQMPAEVDDRFVRYTMARLSAYHNVWWSLANEWDLLHNKTKADWDRMGNILLKEDPYNHLRGLHQTRIVYNEAWMTHACLQGGGTAATVGGPVKMRQTYGKPVVFDEMQYEGDIERRWGRLPPEDMTHRFWNATVCGTYAGHGETYNKSPWSSSGGVLIGQSVPRIAFLRDVLAGFPPDGIDPIPESKDARIGGKPGEFYLLYFGKESPAEWRFELPAHGLAAETKLRVEVIDAWNMTITPVNQVFTTTEPVDGMIRAQGDATVKLPGKPTVALRIKKSP